MRRWLAGWLAGWLVRATIDTSVSTLHAAARPDRQKVMRPHTQTLPPGKPHLQMASLIASLAVRGSVPRGCCLAGGLNMLDLPEGGYSAGAAAGEVLRSSPSTAASLSGSRLTASAF